MTKKQAFSMEGFRAWLVERGAILDAPTNPYELLRCRTCHGVHVVYRNAKGKETWPLDMEDIRAKFLAGVHVPLSPDLKGRVRLRHQIEALFARDGQFCWFCEIGFLSADSAEITIEHLVPKAHGGPNHQSNLVLACQPCNREAGHLSVAEKVALRDRKRGFVCAEARGAA